MCNLVGRHQHFRGSCHLQLQVRDTLNGLYHGIIIRRTAVWTVTIIKTLELKYLNLCRFQEIVGYCRYMCCIFTPVFSWYNRRPEMSQLYLSLFTTIQQQNENYVCHLMLEIAHRSNYHCIHYMSFRMSKWLHITFEMWRMK